MLSDFISKSAMQQLQNLLRTSILFKEMIYFMKKMLHLPETVTNRIKPNCLSNL